MVCVWLSNGVLFFSVNLFTFFHLPVFKIPVFLGSQHDLRDFGNTE